MKLVQTLVVRDEADVVDAQLSYHLNAGVDFVLATDHESRDGTTEILESYEREGYLRLFREQGSMRESEWRTRMARLAASEYGADWIINTDADEFWVPNRGSLKESLEHVPTRFGVVWALTRHFVPRPGEFEPFAERMTARLSESAPVNDPTSPFRPHAKAAHRSDPAVVVLFGSHEVVSDLVPLRGFYPAEVLHFPFRASEQYERKGVRRARGDKPLGQYVKAYEASERGLVEDAYGALVLDDEAVARGEAQGSIVVDTRIRDALRALGPLPPRRSTNSPTFEDEVRLAVGGSVLYEANVVRARRRVDLLQARLRSLEHGHPRRLRLRMRKAPRAGSGR